MPPILKTAETWTARGYLFHAFGRCDACAAPVEFWWSPGKKNSKRLVPINSSDMEAHFATCVDARAFRSLKKDMEKEATA